MQETKKIIIRIDPELADLIPGYLNNRRNDINMIRSSLENNDFPTIELLGHSMKGSGGAYGFDDISDIGGAIEMAAKDGNSEVIKNELVKLFSYLDNMEISYE